MKKQPSQKSQLIATFAASRFFKSRKGSTSKDVLSAHMMTSLQVWAFGKK